MPKPKLKPRRLPFKWSNKYLDPEVAREQAPKFRRLVLRAMARSIDYVALQDFTGPRIDHEVLQAFIRDAVKAFDPPGGLGSYFATRSDGESVPYKDSPRDTFDGELVDFDGKVTRVVMPLVPKEE